MSKVESKVVLISGAKFVEISQGAWKNSEERYKAEGYRRATEEEVISYLGIDKEEKVKPKLPTPGKAKEK